MTAFSRFSATGALRLPLALGVAGLMVTGSAAMAWPVLKTAFAPVTASMGTTPPADPAAVAGFVDMTRAQMTAETALARPADMTAPVLANAATNLMLDASVLRLPRAALDVPPVPGAPAPLQVQQPSPQMQDARPQMAQAPVTRPAPRPAALQPETRQVAAPVPQTTAPRVVPASASVPVGTPAPTGQTRDRLLNLWMSGAYR